MLYSTYTADIITEARALIDAPERWTKYAYARWGDGHPTDVEDPYATSMCFLGAVYCALWDRRVYGTTAEFVADSVARALGFEDRFDLVGWNDDVLTTHEQVMERFDEALPSLL